MAVRLSKTLGLTNHSPLFMFVLNTKRLLLRHLEPEDLEPLYALYRDPEFRKYYPDGTRTLEQTKEELD